MTDIAVRRLTGFAGILAAVLGVVLVPLYFTYSGPPPAWNVLTRNLINMIAAVAILVFLLGLAHLVHRAGARYDWFASLISGAGLLYVAVTLVAISLETGVVLETPDGTVDPTVDGPVAHANMLLHGSIARLLTAVTLFSAGAAIVRSGILPWWIGRGAYVVAVINLAFVPAMFFGDDAADFYTRSAGAPRRRPRHCCSTGPLPPGSPLCAGPGTWRRWNLACPPLAGWRGTSSASVYEICRS